MIKIKPFGKKWICNGIIFRIKENAKTHANWLNRTYSEVL